VGSQVPTDRAGLAPAMGPGDPVLCLPARGAPHHLHDQHHREPAHAIAQDCIERGHFPSDEAATKLLYLALRNITKNWKMAPRTWKEAAYQFTWGARGHFWGIARMRTRQARRISQNRENGSIPAASIVFLATLRAVVLRTPEKTCGFIPVTARRVQGNHRVVDDPAVEVRVRGLPRLGFIVNDRPRKNIPKDFP